MSGLLSIIAAPTGKAGSASSAEGTPAAANGQGTSSLAQFMMLLGGAEGTLTINGQKVSIQNGGLSPLTGKGAEAGLQALHRLSGALVETGGDLQIRSELAGGLDSFEAAVLSFLGMQAPASADASTPESTPASGEAKLVVAASGSNGLENVEGEGVELSGDLLDVVADVLGTFVAAFDAKHGTDFSARFAVSVGANGGSAQPTMLTQPGMPILASLSSQGASEQIHLPAAPLISEAVTRVSRILGVERGMTNAQPTATQTLMMFQPGAPSAVVPTPPSATGLPLDAGWTSPAPGEAVMEGLLERAAGSAQSAKVILEQIAAPNGNVSNGLPSVAALGNASPAPNVMPTPSFDQPRLDLVATLHHSHSDAGEISRFDDALTHTAKARSDHVSQQALQPRFANLILSQMKNAAFSENRMRIELAPRGLGEISISVETDPSGRVQAMVRVENPQVLDLLRTDRAQLESLLAERGFDMAGGSLDFEEFSRGEDDGAGDGDGLAGEAGDLSEELTEEAEATAVIGSDHLDILT